MGSTGSGRFSDYPGSGRSGSGIGGGGGTGGSSGVDPCEQAFSCVLEEVAQCKYHEMNGELPAKGTRLTIEVRERVFAVDENGVAVGALPTRFNYIAGCIKNDFVYVGVVSSTTKTPVPSISVDFMADK